MKRYLHHVPDTMILALQFSRYFVHKITLLYKMLKSEKGDNSVKYLQNFAKS